MVRAVGYFGGAAAAVVVVVGSAALAAVVVVVASALPVVVVVVAGAVVVVVAPLPVVVVVAPALAVVVVVAGAAVVVVVGFDLPSGDWLWGLCGSCGGGFCAGGCCGAGAWLPAAGVPAGAWAGSNTTRTRLFLLSATQRFPSLSRFRSCIVLNCASMAGAGPGSPATFGLCPSGLGWPLPALVAMIPSLSMRPMRAPPSSAT